MTPSVASAFTTMVRNELIIAGEDDNNTEKSSHLGATIGWLTRELIKLTTIVYEKWPKQALEFARRSHKGIGDMLTDLENREHERNAEAKRQEALRPRPRLAAAEGVVLEGEFKEVPPS